MQQLMTAVQLAELLNIPLPLAWKYGREQRIPGVVRLGGRLMRFDRRAVESWLEAGGELPTKREPEPEPAVN